MISQVLSNPTGVYIFKPTLQEQQRASEFWREPGYVISDQCSRLGLLLTWSSEAKVDNATDSISLSRQDLKNQPPNRQGQGQGQEK